MAHRRAVAEVFITDLHEVSDSAVRLCAQVPACHILFNDHEPWLASVDPMALAEISRQAGLVTAYALGIPESSTLATHEWHLDFNNQFSAPYGEVSDLVIDSSFKWTKSRRGIPRSGVCVQEVTLEGQPIARLTATSNFVTPEQLAAIRLAQRGSAPPWSASFPPRLHSDPHLASPSSVGRSLRQNVLLTQLDVKDTIGTAQLSLPFENRALFDHSYDHVPMQILIEGSIQLVFAMVGPPIATRDHRLTSIIGRFDRFVEFDSTAQLVAQLQTQETGTSATVRVLQQGTCAVTIDLEYQR